LKGVFDIWSIYSFAELRHPNLTFELRSLEREKGCRLCYKEYNMTFDTKSHLFDV